MRKLHNLINQKFGRLLVVSKSDKVSKYGQRYWNCICDCGKTTSVLTDSLIRQTRSCGCLRLEAVTKSYGEASFNKAYNIYKRSAFINNRIFILTKEEFKKLTSNNCAYCNNPPKSISKSRINGDYVYNGIDRVDNNRGYELDNCVPCCETCNKMKLSMSLNDFIKHIQRINNQTTYAQYQNQDYII